MCAQDLENEEQLDIADNPLLPIIEEVAEEAQPIIDELMDVIVPEVEE